METEKHKKNITRKKSAGITSDNILEMILYPLHNLLNVEKGSPGLGVTATKE